MTSLKRLYLRLWMFFGPRECVVVRGQDIEEGLDLSQFQGSSVFLYDNRIRAEVTPLD